MKLKFLLACVLALAAFGSLPDAAQAQAPAVAARPLEGLPVRGTDGAVLGVVERVILRGDGRPAQVLVRPRGLRPGGLRSLAFGALRIEPDAVHVPLTKAEFDAMPAVESPAR